MIILYTTETCPKCKIIKDKLINKNISFEECKDLEKLKELNIRSVPVLYIDNEFLDFGKAVKWVNDR